MHSASIAGQPSLFNLPEEVIAGLFCSSIKEFKQSKILERVQESQADREPAQVMEQPIEANLEKDMPNSTIGNMFKSDMIQDQPNISGDNLSAKANSSSKSNLTINQSSMRAATDRQDVASAHNFSHNPMVDWPNIQGPNEKSLKQGGKSWDKKQLASCVRPIEIVHHGSPNTQPNMNIFQETNLNPNKSIVSNSLHRGQRPETFDEALSIEDVSRQAKQPPQHYFHPTMLKLKNTDGMISFKQNTEESPNTKMKNELSKEEYKAPKQDTLDYNMHTDKAGHLLKNDKVNEKQIPYRNEELKKSVRDIKEIEKQISQPVRIEVNPINQRVTNVSKETQEVNLIKRINSFGLQNLKQCYNDPQSAVATTNFSLSKFPAVVPRTLQSVQSTPGTSIGGIARLFEQVTTPSPAIFHSYLPDTVQANCSLL